MIIGAGIDLVQITRIEKILQKYPKNFPKKILGNQELKIYQKIIEKNKSNYLAKRFSAKESLIKAVSALDIDVGFIEVNLLNTLQGKPFFVFNKNSILNQYKVDISLSDDYPCAVSFVIISSLN
ncbi:MAG: holo-ACP synthase [Rickettsia sp.]|nr:holo-ACP synthase [Rickettsia sp.]